MQDDIGTSNMNPGYLFCCSCRFCSVFVSEMLVDCFCRYNMNFRFAASVCLSLVSGIR